MESKQKKCEQKNTNEKGWKEKEQKIISLVHHYCHIKDSRLEHGSEQNPMRMDIERLASNISADELFRTKCIVDYGKQTAADFLSMFYLLHPESTTFQDWNDVPFYEFGLFPMVMLFILIEQLVRLYQGRNLIRFPDIVNNVGAGIFFLFARAITLSIVIHLYMFLYNHYRVVDLPLHSVITWLVSLLLVEFVYYWTHRALHEFNFLWGAHAFHHMDEDVNITTSIRDSVIDLVLYDITPIPLAFLVPPQLLVVHMQFSLIYQIWLHNSVVGNLGFIEYIVNTPAQHRVHHGKNPYCIDTNYGALLMIYDRIFGTYRREKEHDPIVFGIVSPVPRTFNWITLQLVHYKDIIAKCKKMNNTSDKISAWLKGPGWEPGKPRLGLISDVPEPDRSAPKFTYNPFVPIWKNVYVIFHFVIIVMALYFIGHHSLILFSYWKTFLVGAYIIASFTSFSLIFDNSQFMALGELVRLMLYPVFDYYIVIHTPWALLSGDSAIFNWSIGTVRVVYTLSTIFWFYKLISLCFLNYDQREAMIKAKQQNFELKEKNGEILNGAIDSEKHILNTVYLTDVPPYFWHTHRPFSVLTVLVMIVITFSMFGYQIMKVESCRQSLNIFYSQS